MASEDSAVPAPQLPTQDDATQAAANGDAAPEPEKKKRGKPKDTMAPPKPKSGYQQFAGSARERLKAERPELLSDLSGMGKAIAEEWGKVPEEEKTRLQAIYEKEIEIWRPKWAAYKKTDHYKQFVEIKTDWLDIRARKKMQKKMTADAPKRPKSGYMIFGSEIRESVMEQVKADGLGLGDAGRLISERWQALSEAEKARYGEMSAQQKITFDVEFAKYRKSDSFRNYMDAKAKLEAKQGLKKIGRTHMGEAPKRPPSAFSMYRGEVLPGIVAENSKAEGEAKLDMAGIARKCAEMWSKVPEETKQEYTKKTEELKNQWMKDMLEFKTSKTYFNFIETREKIKTKENKELNLRDLPKRPKSVFALFADDHKDKVEPGKGEGKGRHALKTLWTQADEDKKKEYEAKEKALKEDWVKSVEEYKAGPQYQTYTSTVEKVRKEFTTEAIKVTTLKFLRGAPPAPPKSSFGVFVVEKRKRRGSDEPEKMSKAAKREEMTAAKSEWMKLDRNAKAEYERVRLDNMKVYEEQCKEYMAQPFWQEYVSYAKRTKIPVKSLLFHKKKIIRKLKKGEKPKPSWILLPKRPETFPLKAQTAIQIFTAEMRKEMDVLDEIMTKWKELGEDDRKKYEELAAESTRQYEAEMLEFKRSDEGKTFFRELKSAKRRRQVLAAKNKFLDDLPKKPPSAIKKFVLSKASEVKKANPGKKGFELKQIVQDMWKNMEAEERQKLEDEASAELKQFEENLKAFKESPNWKAFQKAVQVRKPKKKAKAKSKLGVVTGPKKPESMPAKPVGAFQTFCKESSGSGKSLGELAKAYKELDSERREELEAEAKERDSKYAEELETWNKSDEGKKYQRAKHNFEVKRKLLFAKKKFLASEPKKPASAYTIFCSEKRQQISADNPDLKNPGEILSKLAETWKNLSDDEKGTYNDKEREKREEYDNDMAEFKKSANYKKYEAVLRKCSGKGKPTKKVGPSPVAVPENMPKKPPNGMQLFGAEQRKEGKSLGLKQLSDAWIQLQAEGQKTYMEQAAEQMRQYEIDMKAFGKTLEGKRYFREKGAALRKEKIKKARARFLEKDDAPKEPKRPPSAYFLFVQEKRSTITDAKFGEVAKRLTTMWNEISADEKKEFEDKADALKKTYDEEMQAFKNSAVYKSYNRAIAGISGKRAQVAKAKAKAKAARGKPDGGRGRGRGRGAPAAGRGRGAAAAAKPADDSDSDVMGSDDNSSSDSSDSD